MLIVLLPGHSQEPHWYVTTSVVASSTRRLELTVYVETVVMYQKLNLKYRYYVPRFILLYTFRGYNSVNIVLLPSEKVSVYKKHFAIRRSYFDSYTVESLVDPFQKGLACS